MLGALPRILEQIEVVCSAVISSGVALGARIWTIG
jgi:hypothetical protein